MDNETGGTPKRSRKLRRLGIAALVVGGASGAIATVGTTADAVPSCTPLKESQGALPYVSKANPGMNLRVCADGSIAGKINTQQLAESRNPLASKVSLPSVRFPSAPSAP